MLSDQGDGEVAAFEDAIRILSGAGDIPTGELPTLTSLGRRWRERAAHHLSTRVDRTLRERPALDSEAAVLAVLKTTAMELRGAGNALETAARELKNKGAGTAAGVAHQAALRVMAAADGLVA